MCECIYASDYLKLLKVTVKHQTTMVVAIATYTCSMVCKIYKYSSTQLCMYLD